MDYITQQKQPYSTIVLNLTPPTCLSILSYCFVFKGWTDIVHISAILMIKDKLCIMAKQKKIAIAIKLEKKVYACIFRV